MTLVPASSHSGGSGLPSQWSSNAHGQVVARTDDGSPALIARQSVDAGAAVFEIENTAGVVVAHIDDDGGVTFSNGAVTTSQQGAVAINADAALGTNNIFQVGEGNTAVLIVGKGAAGGAVQILAQVDADVALSISPTGTGTGDLTRWYDTLGNVAGKITVAGLAQFAGAKLSPITSGALPTAAFVSGTARQFLTTRDVALHVPFTGDATNNAATCKIELSPDNVTYSTLNTVSIAAALNLTGALDQSIELAVPAAWWVKLTAVHGTIGTATYY